LCSGNCCYRLRNSKLHRPFAGAWWLTN
jgi:hypothetical protein